MVTLSLYANQTLVQPEDLPEIIRAAEILQIGIRIENIAVPIDEEGGHSMEWVVTREEEPPRYADWDGRYDEDAEDLLEAFAAE